MIAEADIRKLVDYVLLNACSVSSTGLYNGKAGLSLCLFEVARALEDEYIEEQAFELLQEALLSKNADIGFENGLAGIGFTLLYLIENQFVDADFDEMFGENFAKIMLGLKAREADNRLTPLLNVSYFLNAVQQVKVEEQIAPYVRAILGSVEIFLVKQLSKFTQLRSNQPKSLALGVVEDYLKAVARCPDADFPFSLMESYLGLYQTGRLAASYPAMHYLYEIADRQRTGSFLPVILQGKIDAMKSIYPPALLLSQKIGLLYLLSQDSESAHSQQVADGLASGMFDKSGSELEKNILCAIPANFFIAGYKAGVARLLLYWAFCRTKQHKLDCSRFGPLF
jgi:hypothetical protein